MSIGDILIHKGLLSREQLAQALQRQQKSGTRLDRVLVEMGYVTEDDSLAALGEAMGLPYVELSTIDVDLELLGSMPAKLIHREGILPVQRTDGTLMVATSNPFEISALEELELLTGLKTEPVLATRQEIDKYIKDHLGVAGETIGDMMGQRAGDDQAIELRSHTDVEITDLEAATEASVVKLVNEVIYEAINERASDIHVEPTSDEIRIRYRIDGILHTVPVPQEIHRFRAAIVSRIKIMSSLNIAEKRLPQDGRIKLRLGSRELDIRVSIIPMLFGEAVVLRILDKTNLILELGDLGFDEGPHEQFRGLIGLPNGIILVTGPTGCGKTTTLYASLSEIKNDTIKVVTVEDPVEYHLAGINQIQVHTKIGLTFARGLRSILRHDPDVIMVGEIRDYDTAEAAVQASLTGHLVLSTLHTNDAATAMTRLVNMGVEPFLVTSTIEAVMAQRLVRTICPSCRETHQGDTADLPDDFPAEGEVTLARGKGCRHCRQTGFQGRIGIFELMLVNDEIRDLVMERTASSRIMAAAVRACMVPLRDSGWAKVISQQTTPEEVIRATKNV